MSSVTEQKTKADKRAAALRDNLRKRKLKAKSVTQNSITKSKNNDTKN
jgi:hypothetical protein